VLWVAGGGREMELRDLRLEAVAAALEAARLIMAIYREGPAPAETQSDGSPVTRADRLADAALRARLEALGAGPVLSEEAPIPPWETRRSWTRFWLVDPLDGTRDFVHRTGDFTVNVALVEGGRPVLGVLAAPMLGLAWSAARGEGAFRRAGREERPLPPIAPREGPFTALVSRFHVSPRLAGYLERAGVERRVALGSALKFGRMAEGVADLYPRLSRTMEWDVAAGDCLVHEVGLSLVRLADGRPLEYGKEALENPPFAVLGPRAATRREILVGPGALGPPP
jgi:3'(2'), 5'-bisphosphate nucleotidase